MNDTTNNGNSETVLGTVTSASDSTIGQVTDIPVTDSSDSSGTSSASYTETDAVSDTDSTQNDIPQDIVEDTPVTDTEFDESSDTVTGESIEIADPSTTSGNDTGSSGSSSTPSVDYTTDLTSIRDMLGAQLNEINAVQSVSGNTVMVTIADSEQLAEINSHLTAISALLTMILMCLLFDYMKRSARRTVKGMINNE